ncbi:unnamed protein product [Rhizophagus irregularis]|nr:unnamed protein product [Rhizophagus irregularis]
MQNNNVKCSECGQSYTNENFYYCNPYLENVKFVAHGGFGNVYKAIWKDGPINTTSRVHPWDIKKSRWNRDNNKEVAIKKFRNATVSEFLDEIKNNLSLNFAAYCNVIYGVTRDPHDNKYAIVMKFQNLALDTCKGERPPIPEYTPKPYAALMKRCWDPIPTKRPTAQELYRQIGDWDTILSKFELNDKQIAIKLEIEKEFSQEREDMWKEARLTINPHPLKHSQNSLTSKRLEYSQQLNQLLDKNDTTYYTTRQFDMSLCHPKLKTKEEFSQEPEDRWKIRLSKLITNSYPLKYSQNFLTSKRLEDSKKLHQLNDTTYYTRQFDMSLCLPKVLDNYV